MGFYSASQLVQDLRRHGAEVRGADINCSGWDCSLEKGEGGAAVLRLGLRMVKGLSEETGRHIADRRGVQAYESTQQLLERTGLDRRDLEALASAGALRTLEGHRHQARWVVAGVEKPDGLFASMDRFEATPLLRKPTEGQDIVADYKSVGLTLERHPMYLVRHRLDRYRYVQAERLREMTTGQAISVAGLVITKQRPGTASGVTFVTLEDETGHINLVVWKHIAERDRAALLNARLMGVRGELQIEANVIHVIAKKLIDHTPMLGDLEVKSRDFR
jgi:error-prone DNA polymerase